MSERTPPDDASERPVTGRQAYNLVTDTIAGPNMRFKDNLYQGLAVVVCLAVGAGIGFLFVNDDGLTGALVGGFIGLLVGLFGSGTVLMVYRAARHARGQHD